jgi:UDP-2-acetamido-3-amino-2,3-dideoxy-glucuronate N-acetyltransferase
MIHPLADVNSSFIGENTRIWQYAIVLEGAVIGADCNINCHTLIESQVTIGNNVTIKPGVYVWDGITIEDGVMIGPNVTFTNDKYPKSKNKNFKKEYTKIKSGASIGAAATILGGITVGKHSMIGAGTLILKDVPDRALVAGCPAKIIGWMNEDGSKMKEKEGLYEDNLGQLWEVKKEKLVKL